jgi:hypothetical protein
MSTQIAERGSLFLNNAHTAITALTIWDAVQGRYVPLVGASVTVRIAGTPQGAAISGLGPVTCTEAPAGTYSGTFSATAVSTLTVGTTVYQVVAAGTEAVLSTPLLVRDARYIP